MRKIFQSATIIVFIVMISACANSDSKWSKGSNAKADGSSDTSWQKKQMPAGDQKKATSSYWSEESRY